jgi:hypothetical protein
MFQAIQNDVKKKKGWGNGKEQLSRTQQDHASKLGGQGRTFQARKCIFLGVHFILSWGFHFI